MVADLAISGVDGCPLITPGVGGVEGVSGVALAGGDEDAISIDILNV